MSSTPASNTGSGPSQKRSRPLLGTFLTIEVDSPELISQAFDEASRLEAKFSIYRPDSEISRINARDNGSNSNVTREFADLLELAREISRDSCGAFRVADFELRELTITKAPNAKLDLNGIAKGAIVDALTNFITARAPEASGWINAGGDLRQFGRIKSQVQLRLGSFDRPIARQIELGAEAVATSSLTVAANDPQSRTTYPLKLRKGLSQDSAATVITSRCAVADALTKVALFAEPSIIAKCAEKFAARILIFDSEAKVVETYGDL